MNRAMSPPPYRRFVGTWRLRLDLSVDEEGPAPREETLTVKPAGEAVHMTAVWLDQRGTRRQVVRNFSFSDQDSLFLTLVDERTLESTLKMEGRIVARTRRELSEDGATMKVTLSSTNEYGKPYTIVLHYERV
jgi:hypothetical protein